MQAAIDDLAANFDRGEVWLRTGSTYDPDRPWNVKDGVLLKGNGADVSLSTDTDAVHEPGGSVENLVVDVSGVTFTSNVFTLDAAQYGNYGDRYENTELSGELYGTFGEGTCLYVHQNGASELVSFVDTDIHCEKIGTYLDLYSENVGGWLNGNKFEGYAIHPATGIHLRGPGNVDKNRLEVRLQPEQDQLSDAIIFDAGSENRYSKRISDGIRWASSAIAFNSGVGSDNLIMQIGGGLDTNIVDNADDPTNAVLGADFIRGRGYSVDRALAIGKFIKDIGQRATAFGTDASALAERSTSIGEATNAEA